MKWKPKPYRPAPSWDDPRNPNKEPFTNYVKPNRYNKLDLASDSNNYLHERPEGLSHPQLPIGSVPAGVEYDEAEYEI